MTTRTPSRPAPRMRNRAQFNLRGRLLLVVSTPTITVTGSTLRVGRATIERRFLGAVAAFRGKEATAERGTRLNGLAFTCFRGWVDPVVRIEITDPLLVDIHPASGPSACGPPGPELIPSGRCSQPSPASPRSPCST